MFRKKNFEDMGNVDLEKLEPVSSFEETGKMDSLTNIPEDSKNMYEILLRFKKKEEIYNKSILILIIMNLFLTAIVIYLGIVKIS